MTIDLNNVSGNLKNNYKTDIKNKPAEANENYLFDNLNNLNGTEELSRKRNDKRREPPPPPPPPEPEDKHPHRPHHDKKHHDKDDDYIVIRIGGIEFIIKKKEAELNTTKEIQI